MNGNGGKTEKQKTISITRDAANEFYEALDAAKTNKGHLATRAYNACKNLTRLKGVDVPKDLITMGAAALKVQKGFGIGTVVLVGEVLTSLGYIKNAYDWSVPAGQRATPRYSVLVAAMSGWTGYGYKDGEYIADVQAFFDKALDQARLGIRNGKPYLYEYLSEVEDIENAGL